MLEHARFRWVLFVTFLLSLTCLSTLGQAQRSPGSGLPKRFAQAVDLTVRKGVQAKLPPHISTLLGISQEQETPVMQTGERIGKIVQGIDVSIANNNDVVLFVVDESAKDQTVYLTSPQGRLRKMVLVKAGEGAVARITEKDRNAFEQLKQFWIDRLSPTEPPKAAPSK